MLDYPTQHEVLNEVQKAAANNEVERALAANNEAGLEVDRACLLNST
jgi:hypothetical protein